MLIGNKTFNNEDFYIMGILNVTPDSFSDGGKYNDIDNTKKRIESMISEGVDIIDVGGESNRPGYTTMLSEQEEIERVSPVIEYIKKSYDIPVSIDTYKAKVANEAAKLKVDLINDIWGLFGEKVYKSEFTLEMAEVIKNNNLSCCLMHNRDIKKNPYGVFLNDLKSDIINSIDKAIEFKIPKEKIMIDPGIGFAKSYEHNLLTMKNLQDLTKLGYPLLLGTSRKSMIGLTLDLPVDSRLEGTLATTAYGAINGCSFFRVHDIKENKRVLDMIKAIVSCSN